MQELAGKKVIVIEPMDGIDSQFDLLRQSGCELSIGPYVSESGRGYTSEQLVELGNSYDAIIGVSRDHFTRDILARCERVQIIGKLGIGIDHIDIPAATGKGILIANTPMHAPDVAEFAIGLMLSLIKKLPIIEQRLREGGWRDMSTAGGSLLGATVGLLGFGTISREVARRLSGWGCHLIAYDPFISQAQCDASGIAVTLTDWYTLFSTSDVISVHLPLNAQTRGCVGADALALMKQGAVLVNTARGPIVDAPALADAVSHDRILAAIDTHVIEPVGRDYPLLQYRDNLILTPHCAGWSIPGLSRCADCAAENTVLSLTGTAPRYTVNPDAIPLWRTRFWNAG